MLAPAHFAKRPEPQVLQGIPMPNFDEIPTGPVSHNQYVSSSVGEAVPMAIDTPKATAQHPAQRPPLWHTFALEAGGPDMNEFTKAMKADAAMQESIVDILGGLLEKTIERNDRLGRNSELTEFEAGKACPLTASAYLKRIMKYGGCSPCCVIVGIRKIHGYLIAGTLHCSAW